MVRVEYESSVISHLLAAFDGRSARICKVLHGMCDPGRRPSAHPCDRMSCTRTGEGDGEPVGENDTA